MKATLLFCFFILLACSNSQGQSHDFVLVKKRNKTIQRLFAGQYFIAAIDSSGPYPLLVKNVFKDSLRLMSYTLQNNGTGYGGSYIDTVGRYYFTIHYQNITALYANRNKNFNLSGSALTLVAAGGLGVLITVVNGAEVSFAAGSLVLSGIGFLLARKSNGEMKMGKKYKLVYVNVDR